MAADHLCVVTCTECSPSGAQQGAVVVVLYAMLCVLLCMLSCYKHTLPARELRQVVMFMQGKCLLGGRGAVIVRVC